MYHHSGILLVLAAVLLSACSPTQSVPAVSNQGNVVPISASVPTATASPNNRVAPTLSDDTGEFCAWFIQANVLRAQRISKLSRLGEWAQKYAPNNFAALDAAGVTDLQAIIKEHQPYQRKFVEDWIKLGAHPVGKEFWDLELQSVKIRIEAFDLLADGTIENGSEKLDRGFRLWGESARVGTQGEALLPPLSSKCTK